MAYIANTPDDVRVMLGAIGLDSLDQLFDMIPPEYRLRRPLDIPPALSELELTNHIGALAAKNQGADARPCFLGGGSYDHFIPAVVDNLAARGEFYTAYTPYQAEASQGTLQATFEYQTLIAQITGMDVSNASLYDGGSAVSEAVLMAMTATRRLGRVVVAGSIHPEYVQILRTNLANLEPEVVVVPHRDGKVDPADLAAAITDETCAVVVAYPNFFGQLEDVDGSSPRPGRAGPWRSSRSTRSASACSAGPGRMTPTSWWPRGSAWATPGLRRPVPRHPRLPRVDGPQDARPGGRPDGGPLRQALLRADAPDPRAAHPPREGDLEHLHQPGPARPPRQHLPGRRRPRRAPQGRRALDPQGPLRRREARRGPRPPSPSPARSSRSS